MTTTYRRYIIPIIVLCCCNWCRRESSSYIINMHSYRCSYDGSTDRYRYSIGWQYGDKVWRI